MVLFWTPGPKPGLIPETLTSKLETLRNLNRKPPTPDKSNFKKRQPPSHPKLQKKQAPKPKSPKPYSSIPKVSKVVPFLWFIFRIL